MGGCGEALFGTFKAETVPWGAALDPLSVPTTGGVSETAFGVVVSGGVPLFTPVLPLLFVMPGAAVTTLGGPIGPFKVGLFAPFGLGVPFQPFMVPLASGTSFDPLLLSLLHLSLTFLT